MAFVDQTCRRLKKEFPNIRTPLKYKAPHELAIAVILSAQCTDEQVNRVTPKLFNRLKTPESVYKAPLATVEKLIYSTGFYKNKAKNIRGFCKMLVKDFGGQMPKTLSELVRMPGVGRKTANVILQELYGISVGVVVDTHVSRISRLWGLTKQKDAYKIEKDLMAKVPSSSWIDWSLLLIFLGRKYCTARVRLCGPCPLNDICPACEKKAYV